MAVMVGGWVLAWNRFAFIASVQRFTYIPLWMGLIVALNGLVYKRSGHSPLTHETKSYLTLFPVSAAFWLFFEYLNRYVWNWFYVNVLDDIATGNWSRIVRFAVASLHCGLVWEMWNINSFTKWIYAIPYVHRFQYFEMPLLGLFGYIPFGIECLVVTDAWMKLRSNN